MTTSYPAGPLTPKPYPWKEIRRFDLQLDRSRVVRRLAVVGTLLAALLSLVSFAVLAWAWRGYRRTNDDWRWRPTMIIIAGLLLAAVTFRPQAWVEQITGLGSAPGSAGILGTLLVAALGPALVLAGAAAAGFCYAREWTEHRYLEPTGWTLRQRWRFARNVRNLRSGRLSGGRVRFGAIIGDPLPWRTPRRGMLAARPLAELGHGCILGESATDTAITAAAVADQTLAAGGSVLYLDSAGTADTLARTAAIAARREMAPVLFDVGIGTSRSRWYDPLGWPGTPAEKAVALLAALAHAHAEDDQPGYDPNTRSWVEWQFAAMAEFGLFPGESRFDFLLDTCDPDRLRDRIERHRTGHDGPAARYATWESRLRPYAREQLTDLAEDLITIVNAAGPRLRPSHPGDQPIAFDELDAAPGLVHLRLAAAGDTDFVRRALLALTIKDLTSYALERSSGDHRDLLVLADQSGTTGDAIPDVDDLITAAEGAHLWVWSVTSEPHRWPSPTRTGLAADGATMIIHRLRDFAAAESVCEAVGTGPILEPDTFSSDAVSLGGLLDEHPGELRGRIGRGRLLTPEDLETLPDHDAYVCFTEIAEAKERRSATVERWQSRRVGSDEQAMDVPLVRVIAPTDVLTPAPVADRELPTFTDLVAPAAELAQARSELLPPSEARKRRMADYRSRSLPSIGGSGAIGAASAPFGTPGTAPATPGTAPAANGTAPAATDPTLAAGAADAEWWEDATAAAANPVESGSADDRVDPDAEWQDDTDGWAEQWEPVDAPPLGTAPVSAVGPQKSPNGDGSGGTGSRQQPSVGESRPRAGGPATTTTGADQGETSGPGNGGAMQPSGSGRSDRSRRTPTLTQRSDRGRSGDDRTP